MTPIIEKNSASDARVTLAPDEKRILDVVRQIKHHGFGDLTVSYEDKQIVKLWTVTKHDTVPLRCPFKMREITR